MVGVVLGRGRWVLGNDEIKRQRHTRSTYCFQTWSCRVCKEVCVVRVGADEVELKFSLMLRGASFIPQDSFSLFAVDGIADAFSFVTTEAHLLCCANVVVVQTMVWVL